MLQPPTYSCLEDFGGVVIVTGVKQSQLLVFWTRLGLEFDNMYVNQWIN